MGFFRSTGKVIGLMFNFRVDKWLGYKNLKNTSFSLFHTVKHILTVQNANIRESFPESLQRLNITEQDLIKKHQQFYRLMLVYLLMSAMIAMYAIYLAFNGMILSFITSLALTCLCLSHYFRYSFWLFQIKHKKLGCSLKEWLNGNIIDKIEQHE
jgi:intracellular multiplication protein IcmV